MSTEDLETQWANEPIDETDVALLASLRTAFTQADPVPDGMIDRIAFAMSVAALEADVAEVVGQAQPALSATRAQSYERATRVTFASGEFSAMVTIESGPGALAGLHGWATTPGSDIELRERAKTQLTTADEQGRFAFRNVERGMAHLVFRRPGGETAPIITPAFEI